MANVVPQWFAMSYQKKNITSLPDPNSTRNMYGSQQHAAHLRPDTPVTVTSTDSSALSALMLRLDQLTLESSMPSAQLPAQPSYTPSGTVFYTPDGQMVYAPAYATAAAAQAGDYLPYPIFPFIGQGAAAYQPAMPYTPGRHLYTDRIEQLNKDLPALENRRGSYSTNESTPGTPFYGALPQHTSTYIAAFDRSPLGSTPSPQQFALQPGHHSIKPVPYRKIPVDVDIDALIKQHPAIPYAVPAVYTPREHMRTLDQSLANPIPGNRNVYIRGLLPDTNDETLAAYAARFGRIETSKAIIENTTGACKGFGFAKFFDVRHSELCIRGFYVLGYEVGFARESFNSRLKAEGDQASTNLYVSNLPKNMTEAELGAIFMDYTVESSRILRDKENRSRGVGFARFESREVCDEIIRKFHGQPIGEEGLLLQVRYADTPQQKDLKRITTERRQFRTNEYNIGAYGAMPDYASTAMVPSYTPPAYSRAGSLHRNFDAGSTSRASGSWKRDFSVLAPGDVNRQTLKIDVVAASPKIKQESISGKGSAVSEDNDGVKIHCESPAIVHSDTASVSKM